MLGEESSAANMPKLAEVTAVESLVMLKPKQTVSLDLQTPSLPPSCQTFEISDCSLQASLILYQQCKYVGDASTVIIFLQQNWTCNLHANMIAV
jgi:hypothetical protein